MQRSTTSWNWRQGRCVHRRVAEHDQHSRAARLSAGKHAERSQKDLERPKTRVTEGGKTVGEGRAASDSDYRTFWETQNQGDGTMVSGCGGTGAETEIVSGFHAAALALTEAVGHLPRARRNTGLCWRHSLPQC